MFREVTDVYMESRKCIRRKRKRNSEEVRCMLFENNGKFAIKKLGLGSRLVTHLKLIAEPPPQKRFLSLINSTTMSAFRS